MLTKQNSEFCRLMYFFPLSVASEISHVDESDTGPDRNPGCGTTNGSDGRIIITPHLITIHLISTMGCNFTQPSDPTIDFNDMGTSTLFLVLYSDYIYTIL
jgi:hypothetical protein